MNRGTIVRNDIIYSGEKDKVSYISEQIEGTKIGTLTINGVDNDIIAPKGGGEGGASSWQDLEDKPFETLSDNFKVEDGILDIDGDFGSKVEASATLTEGNKIGSITIDDNDPVNFYSPKDIIEITKAEYDKLTEDEKKDKTYFIKDWNGLPSSRVYNGPIGEILSFMGTTAPNNFLVCDGSIYNIADYLDLANHINKHFGSFNYFGGDGISTFAVPDLRGEFLRGTGANGHNNQGNGSAVGVHQNATTHTRLEMESQNRTLRYASGAESSINNPDSIGSNADGGFYFSNIGTSYGYNQWGSFTSRPTNTSVLYCIRYKEAGGGGLSSEYLQLSAIMLDNRYTDNDWYRISTGVNIKDYGDNLILEEKIQPIWNDSYAALGLVSYKDEDSICTRIIAGTSTGSVIIYWNSKAGGGGITRSISTTNPSIIKWSKEYFYINGERYNMTIMAGNDCNTEIEFARLTLANKGQYLLHYGRIFNGEELVREYIPVKRFSDGEVGFYETVEKKFYPNEGTGKFVAIY